GGRRMTDKPPPIANLQLPVAPFVSLVGAGPGDPGLITVKGLQRIAEADVIVYDKLASESLLDHARADAELIYMGKIGGGPTHAQEAINDLLVEKAREGKRVVRLKGGDPYVFGRGGEEGEALHNAGIPFEVVPGVTSAVAVPSYAGIPVTHRGLAQSFAVITGHEALPGGPGSTPEPGEGLPPGINWPGLAGVDTLVFLMGIRTLPEIASKLIEHGRSPDTPAAVIRMGTTAEQRTVAGTLGDIVSRIKAAGLTPPAITVVGEVVRMRDALSWFEDRPLFGKRVLITRTRKQASVLARLLADEGAIPVELPAIEIEPVADRSELDAAIGRLVAGHYAWAVFTSANAVEEFFGAVESQGLDARAFGQTRVCTIGPATAAALAEHGIRADLIPHEYIAESIVEAMRPLLHRSDHILIPRAEGARAELIDGLAALGPQVDEVSLYRAALPAEAPPEALDLLRNGGIDIVTFTSSSTVRNLVDILGQDATAILNGTHTSPGVILSSTEPASQDDAPSSVILSSTLAGAQDDAPPRRDLEVGGEGSTPARGQPTPTVAQGPGPEPTAPRRPLIACIGPITAQTARDLRLPVDIEASEHTVEGLVAALREFAL
ncbi:MAG TPA: uroporphyrinogen-III C-methyltransferase, partial [Dehalococcoidia bacterium]|nr:uroporphyrinogen-III C-methyltransferase [Dehalococcoidia bacterium]